jgi:hypothetical protein
MSINFELFKGYRDDVTLAYGPVLCTVRAVESYLKKSLKPSDVKHLEEAFAKIPEQCLMGNNMNPQFDHRGIVTLASYPVWRTLWTMDSLKNHGSPLKPNGVSGLVMTSDRKFVAMKRSSKNDRNKSELGCVAGFMRALSNGNITSITTLAKACFQEEMQGEIGVLPEETKSINLLGTLKLPDQNEFVLQAKIGVSSKELFKRRSEYRADHLMERDLFFLDECQLKKLLLDSEIRGAPQHLFALASIFYGRELPFWNDILKNIERSSYGKPSEGLEKILERLRIPYDFFEN